MSRTERAHMTGSGDRRALEGQMGPDGARWGQMGPGEGPDPDVLKTRAETVKFEAIFVDGSPMSS